MLIYIAGPMTGLADLGRAAFAEAESKLRALGWDVLNPARLPEDWPKELYLPVCFEMVKAADWMVLLPGWEKSKGAVAEAHFAEYQGKRLVEMEMMERCQVRVSKKHEHSEADRESPIEALCKQKVPESAKFEFHNECGERKTQQTRQAYIEASNQPNAWKG